MHTGGAAASDASPSIEVHHHHTASGHGDGPHNNTITHDHQPTTHFADTTTTAPAMEAKFVSDGTWRGDSFETFEFLGEMTLL